MTPVPPPDMTVQLAVCGLALRNEQDRQFKDAEVEHWGQIRIGPYLLTPGKPCPVAYSEVILDAINRGIIVNLGLKPTEQMIKGGKKLKITKKSGGKK